MQREPNAIQPLGDGSTSHCIQFAPVVFENTVIDEPGRRGGQPDGRHDMPSVAPGDTEEAVECGAVALMRQKLAATPDAFDDATLKLRYRLPEESR